MPLYSFQCDDCDAEFETLVRSSDTPECPKCDGTKLTKQLSLVARPSSGGDVAASGDAASCMMPSSGGCCGGGPCGGHGM